MRFFPPLESFVFSVAFGLLLEQTKQVTRSLAQVQSYFEDSCLMCWRHFKKQGISVSNLGKCMITCPHADIRLKY